MKANLKENINDVCRKILARRIKEYRVNPCAETMAKLTLALGYFPSKHFRTIRLLDRCAHRTMRASTDWCLSDDPIKPAPIPKSAPRSQSMRRSLTVQGARDALAKRIRTYRADRCRGTWKRVDLALCFFPEKRRRIELRLYHWLCRVDPHNGKPARLHKPTISREELKALMEMFTKHGRAWKVVLRNQWQHNTAHPTLLKLRDVNHFGLTMLDKLKIADLQRVKAFYDANP